MEVIYHENDFSFISHEKDCSEHVFGQKAIPIQERTTVEENAEVWETFYQTHQHKFFKKRRYMPLAFPQVQALAHSSQHLAIANLGCGHGSCIIPFLETFQEQGTVSVDLLGVDISRTALNSFQQLCNKPCVRKLTVIEADVSCFNSCLVVSKSVFECTD